MAWRSSGTTNDEMVDNLKRFRVISSPEVEAAFRNVDRKFFVPKETKRQDRTGQDRTGQNLKSKNNIAHKDQPIRDGNIHISAPHIYGSVLEALELKKDAGYSFLNAGSGTGYLTCIAASVLGPRSMHYCIELHEDVLNHSREAIAAWKKATTNTTNTNTNHHWSSTTTTTTNNNNNDEGRSNIDLIHGNALELNTNRGECALGFDRIYIGASIQKLNLHMFKKLLKPGGVLVGPVGDELVQITRSLCEHHTTTDGGNHHYHQQQHQFVTTVISGVRFAPLMTTPSAPVVIPALVWDPTNHGLYPNNFRGACQQLLLCSNASTTQPLKVRSSDKNSRINAASMLPRALWVEILSYTHRNWFDVPLNEVDFLRRRLAEEQANVERANKANREVESRLRIAERERDIYKVLARTLRSRLHNGSSSGDDSDESPSPAEDYTVAMILEERAAFGLGRVLRSAVHNNNNNNNYHHRGDAEMGGEDGDEDFEFSDDNADDAYEDNNNNNNNEDEDEDMSEVMEDALEHLDEEDDDDDSEDDGSISVASDDHAPDLISERTSSISILLPHSRKVSVSEEDIV
eukprot:jgi/Psemu1/69205/estExt_Genemark1.C_7590011